MSETQDAPLFTKERTMPSTCTIDAAAAREAATLCLSAVKLRSPQPALQAIHIRKSPLGVEFVGTDIVTAVGVGLAAEGELTGAVPADLFAKAIKCIEGETVVMSRDGARLTIAGDSGKFQVPIQDFDMPPFTPPAGAEPIALDGDQLADAIRRVSVVLDGEPTTFRGCVQIEPADAAVHVTATTGIVFSSVRLPAVCKVGPGIVLSAEDAADIASVVEGGPATLTASDGRAFAVGGQRWALAVAQEVRYPDWRGMVSTVGDPIGPAEFDRDELLSAFQSASVVLDGIADTAVTLRVSGRRFTVSAMSSARGYANRSGVTSGGDESDRTVVLNAKQITSALRTAGGEKVTVAFTDRPRGPVHLNPGTGHVQILVQVTSEPAPAVAPSAAA